MIVMSRKLDRERPDLAAKFYAAFEKAKHIAYDDILERPRRLFGRLPARENERANGSWGDPWKYGIKANQIDHRRVY